MTLVPAAHVPMYGVLSSCQTGTWASATVVWRPPKTAATFSRSTQLARDGDALLRVALVVADDQLELAPAEHAALAVDLVDGDLRARA